MTRADSWQLPVSQGNAPDWPKRAGPDSLRLGVLPILESAGGTEQERARERSCAALSVLQALVPKVLKLGSLILMIKILLLAHIDCVGMFILLSALSPCFPDGRPNRR